jgi:hypothetical protein
VHDRRALVLVAMLVGLVFAPPAGSQVPARYRYTGWVSQVAGRQPQHMIVAAGSFRLMFNDYGNASGTEAYRVCYGKVGHTPSCLNRSVNGVRVNAVRRTLTARGAYIARWYVGGHRVASWAFLVVQGD